MTKPPPTAAARTVLRGAVRQAMIEMRIQLLSPVAFSWLFFPGVGLLVLSFLRDNQVMGSDISLSQLGIPGILAMNLVSTGIMGVAGQVTVEQEDGTVLRAKAVPHAILSHVIGSVLLFTATTVAPLVLLLVVSAAIFGVAPVGAAGWVTLLWVSLLGLAATLPWGAIMGSLMRSVTLLWLVSLVIYGGMAISGIFYPISALPGWLQTIGQLLPTYWIGLGMRSALLPESAQSLELAGSWQTWPTVGALALWAAVGLALAPGVLRRMSRRQSGSLVQAARERTLARGY